MTQPFTVLFSRVAGLDVHQAQVTACVRLTHEDARVVAFSLVFETTPTGLAALRDWLRSKQVTHVVMESTGVYWMPVFTILEPAGFDLTVCNAHHAKNVPGRKTDQSDAAWLAQLMAAGLLRKSFVPPHDLRMLRELTRARVHAVEARSEVVHQVHRLLERAGIKLSSVVTDLQGKTASAILQALAKGEHNADTLANLAHGSLRSKKAALREVLQAPLCATERWLLKQHLKTLAHHDTRVEELDRKIEVACKPYKAQVERIQSAGGLESVGAAVVLAELGANPDAFADAKHAAAWAGLAPGNHESAGKHRRSPSREGNRYLKRILVQAAMALSRSKTHDLAEWLRKKKRIGFKKALVATAHKLLVRLWTMLKKGEDYQAPESSKLTESQKRKLVDRKVAGLRALGYAVSIQPLPALT